LLRHVNELRPGAIGQWPFGDRADRSLGWPI
jgi:hypothetical protein